MRPFSCCAGGRGPQKAALALAVELASGILAANHLRGPCERISEPIAEDRSPAQPRRGLHKFSRLRTLRQLLSNLAGKPIKPVLKPGRRETSYYDETVVREPNGEHGTGYKALYEFVAACFHAGWTPDQTEQLLSAGLEA